MVDMPNKSAANGSSRKSNWYDANVRSAKGVNASEQGRKRVAKRKAMAVEGGTVRRSLGGL